ncbi:SDR family NAD(P)-dependent oxidoreductase [Niveispirillum sp. SYP-B3756]|uniref:SDR family NAD(P)-dependent oxidoreductase n=1 Tax=Niveispirillum sp. SYP-B3756 TaxID=2662178 RepID=UPI001290E4B6|nr:SDR family NAD(P)-dependent oxidoreductase [Niveispirillum sp. SYP-B3756]MQP68408.1 SDR family NAD(P)-dependent oxidoreductase [Niveispirillum sp. SYP-B3756]
MSQHPPRDKRDPLARRKERHTPPGLRSSALHALSARAAAGRFVLQSCQDCGAMTYPPRDACPQCWGELVWQDQARGALVLCETTIRATTDLYFRDHLPWRMGKLALDAGPTALAHLHADLKPGDRAEMHLMLDKGGNAALFALPAGGRPDMDDRQWREFTVPVKDRIVLVSDARSAVGRAVVKALHSAGAGLIFAGMAPPARAADLTDEWAGLDRVQTLPFDITDSSLVAEGISKIAGPLDIVINTARFVRGGRNLVDQKRMMDIAVLGFMRLSGACAPMLAGRPAGAFVDLVSIQALAGEVGFAGYAAAEAAHLSLLQSFRHDMRAQGVRVLSIFSGPSDDEDYQSVPPPKVAPARLAREVVEALRMGREISCVGEVASDAMERWLADPALFVREKNL